MRRLSSKQRHKRIRETYQDAVLDAHYIEEDAGLRFGYAEQPRLPISVICCPMGKAINHGGILRVAEAFRCQSVSYEREPDDAADFAGARGVTNWLPFSWKPALEAVQEAKAQGTRIYGLTLTPTSKALRDVDWQFPAALVLGEERHGMPNALMEECDEFVAIPMWGLITSINIGQACAIALEHMANACWEQTPELGPVRNTSRRLVGLPPVDYTGYLPPSEQDSESGDESA